MGATALRFRRCGECQQVAAVCYRVGRQGVEFLLIRTRGDRWTFPKGRVESRLTLAQTAALEAFEEAGVHGRMEEAPFASYLHRKRGGEDGAGRHLTVQAHLCEVLWLGPAQERRRARTWFSLEKAKRRLSAGRSREDAEEFARVLERAASRIQRLSRLARTVNSVLKDPLREARFEASPAAQLSSTAFASFPRRPSPQTSAEIELAVNAYLGETARGDEISGATEPSTRRAGTRGKVLQLGPPQENGR